VYHGEEISKAPISGGEQAVTGQGNNTTYMRKRSRLSSTCCVYVPLNGVGKKEDPFLTEIGSVEKQRQ